MAKIKEHRIALELRKKDQSYSQIKKKIRVSKSTLSRWLKKYPLSKERISELRGRNEKRIEKFRQTMRAKRKRKLYASYKKEKRKLIPLSKKEFFIAGLFLYWGEGDKTSRYLVSINNTDPGFVKFALVWFVKSLGIPKRKIRIYLHLYSDMNINKEIQYWSNELNISKRNFNKPYIKMSRRVDLDHKGFIHGTCTVRVCDVVLKDKIRMALKAISDCYGPKVEEI